MNIGKRIKERRKELDMSVDAVAKKLGKNKATIYRYENNEIENLPISILEPLAKILDTTPAYLMGWELPEYFDAKYPNMKKELEEYENKNKLISDFDKLNDLGKRKVLTYTKDLTEMPKYQNNAVDTIAAHNDYVDNNDELSKINEDIEDMKNW